MFEKLSKHKTMSELIEKLLSSEFVNFETTSYDDPDFIYRAYKSHHSKIQLMSDAKLPMNEQIFTSITDTFNKLKDSNKLDKSDLDSALKAFSLLASTCKNSSEMHPNNILIPNKASAKSSASNVLILFLQCLLPLFLTIIQMACSAYSNQIANAENQKQHDELMEEFQNFRTTSEETLNEIAGYLAEITKILQNQNTESACLKTHSQPVHAQEATRLEHIRDDTDAEDNIQK